MTDHGLSRLARNASHNVLALLLPAVLSIVATPFIVHRLGDERFGLYMLALSAVGFGGLLDLGLDTAAVKYVAAERARKDLDALAGLLNSLVTIRLLLGALAGAIGVSSASFLCERVLAVAPASTPDATYVVRIGSLSVGIGMVVGTLSSLPRAAHRFDITSRITLISSIGLTLITVGLVSFGRGIRDVAAAELLVTTLQAVVYWHVARTFFPEWRFRLSVEAAWLRKLLAFGSLGVMGNMTAMMFVHVNRIIVGRFLGAAAVTYFAVPWSVSTRVAQLIYSMADVLTPLASSLNASDSADQLERVYRRVTKAILLLCGTIAVPLFLTAPDLLGLWMGPAFAERSGGVLRLLTVSATLQGLSMVAYVVLTGMGRPAAANVPAVAGALVNLGAALALGPKYGLLGVAGAVVVGVAVQTALLEWRVDVALARAWRDRAEEWRILLAASAAVVVGLVAGRPVVGPWARLVVLTVLGLASFHGLVWAMGSYTRSERDVLMRQIRTLWPARDAHAPLQSRGNGGHRDGSG